MTAARLDRLSALLEGLAPSVSLTTVCETRAGPGAADGAEFRLYLYLLTKGTMVWRSGTGSVSLNAPSLLACRSCVPYELEGATSQDRGNLISIQTDLTGPVAGLFLAEFAQPRVVTMTSEEPLLELAMGLIATELDSPRCGQPALLSRAGDILFIGLLRYLVAHPSPQGSGLFNGLADPRIARALVAMHGRPSLAWTLERLADEAGMSRTAFASTFRQVMHKTPGKYLAAIRLAIAQRAVELGKGLKLAAREAGYTNASALSRALSRRQATGS